VKYLLDVNALLAAIIANHPHHAAADRWLLHKQLVTCPLSELGFIRVSTNPKAYGYSMALARQALQGFIAAHHAEFIPADLPALASAPSSSPEVTNAYLAELADRARMKLATFDANIKHTATEVIT
jgi:uncharacterized protein